MANTIERSFNGKKVLFTNDFKGWNMLLEILGLGMKISKLDAMYKAESEEVRAKRLELETALEVDGIESFSDIIDISEFDSADKKRRGQMISKLIEAQEGSEGKEERALDKESKELSKLQYNLPAKKCNLENTKELLEQIVETTTTTTYLQGNKLVKLKQTVSREIQTRNLSSEELKNLKKL